LNNNNNNNNNNNLVQLFSGHFKTQKSFGFLSVTHRLIFRIVASCKLRWAENVARMVRQEMHTEILWRNLLENPHLRHREWYGKIILIWRLWMGDSWNWLRIVPNGGPRYLAVFNDLMLLPCAFFITEHHTMNTYWGCGGIAPRVLDLGTSWR